MQSGNIFVKIQLFLLFLLVTLLGLYYHPYIFSVSGDMEKGNILSNYILLIFALLFLSSIFVFVSYKIRVVRVMILLIVFISLYSILVYSLFDNSMMFQDLRILFIVFCSIIIGIQLRLTEKQILFFLLYYALLISFTGFMQVWTNIGGFEIKEVYIVENKNALGVALSSSVVISFLLFFYSKKNIYKIACLFLAVFCVIVLLTIRARMSTLTSFCFIFIVLILRAKLKLIILFFPLISLFFLGLYFYFPDFISDYITESLFAGTVQKDFTSGRGERNFMALSFLMDNLLLGNVDQSFKIPLIHNYPLLKLYNYGLIFSCPILILYFYLLSFVLKNIYIYRGKNTFCVFGLYLLLIPFMVSMAEPGLPFGPGTTTVFNFIIFGISLKMCRENKYCKTY